MPDPTFTEEDREAIRVWADRLFHLGSGFQGTDEEEADLLNRALAHIEEAEALLHEWHTGAVHPPATGLARRTRAFLSFRDHRGQR